MIHNLSGLLKHYQVSEIFRQFFNIWIPLRWKSGNLMHPVFGSNWRPVQGFRRAAMVSPWARIHFLEQLRVGLRCIETRPVKRWAVWSTPSTKWEVCQVETWWRHAKNKNINKNRIQDKTVIQVNHSKYLFQWNTGNGTTYILFWYQGTTVEMLQNVNEVKQRAHPHCSGI